MQELFEFETNIFYRISELREITRKIPGPEKSLGKIANFKKRARNSYLKKFFDFDIKNLRLF
jgi:hypothetical protein